jgi:hypothetical protein
MTTNAKAHVQMTMDLALLTPDELYVDENNDAMWADYGRMVHSRLMATDDLIATLNRAGLRSKSVKEYVGYIRAFILAGSRP